MKTVQKRIPSLAIASVYFRVVSILAAPLGANANVGAVGNALTGLGAAPMGGVVTAGQMRLVSPAGAQ